MYDAKSAESEKLLLLQNHFKTLRETGVPSKAPLFEKS
jgi:hypothetical protein